MRNQSDKMSAAEETQELWNLIMRIAEPTDLLKTILDRAAPRPDQNGPGEMTTISGHCIVLHGCTVTIHHTPTPAAETGV